MRLFCLFSLVSAGLTAAWAPQPCKPGQLTPSGTVCTNTAGTAMDAAQGIADYAAATVQRAATIKTLQQQQGECGNCARAGEIKARLDQLLREDAAIRAGEGEMFRAMGFPMEVTDMQSAIKWFIKGMTAEPPSLVSWNISPTAANYSIVRHCEVINDRRWLSPFLDPAEAAAALADQSAQAKMVPCIAQFRADDVVSNRKLAMRYCFLSNDFYKDGSRTQYNACMNQNDILTAFCTQERTILSSYQRRRTPVSADVACEGPKIDGRELNVLRYGGSEDVSSVRSERAPGIVRISDDLMKVTSRGRQVVKGTLLFEITSGREILVPKGADVYLEVERIEYKDAPGNFGVAITGQYATVGGKRYEYPTERIVAVESRVNRPPFNLDVWYTSNVKTASRSGPGLPAALTGAVLPLATGGATVAQGIQDARNALPIRFVVGTSMQVILDESIDMAGVMQGRTFRGHLANAYQPDPATAIPVPAGTAVMLKVRNLGSGGTQHLVHLGIAMETVAAPDGSRQLPITSNEVHQTLSTGGTSTGVKIPSQVNVGGISIGAPARISSPGAIGQIQAQTRLSFTVNAPATYQTDALSRR